MSTNQMLNSEIIEINPEQIDNATVLAQQLSDPETRKRGLIDILGINCAYGYFKVKGVRADIKKSIYKIPSLFEEFKITDIYNNGYRTDVITLYQEKTVKIPKIHVDMDIMPDFYFVVQIGSKIKEAKMIGFLSQKAVLASSCDNKFLYPNLDDIFDIEKFRRLTNVAAPIRPIPPKHTQCMELFLKFMDNELPLAYKRELIKHLIDCPMCREKLNETIEFERLANNISKYPDLVEKYKNKTIPIPMDAIEQEENISNKLEEGITNLNFNQGLENFDEIDRSEVPKNGVYDDISFYQNHQNEQNKHQNHQDENGAYAIETFPKSKNKKRKFTSYDRQVEENYNVSNTQEDQDDFSIQYRTSSSDTLSDDEILYKELKDLPDVPMAQQGHIPSLKDEYEFFKESQKKLAQNPKPTYVPPPVQEDDDLSMLAKMSEMELKKSMSQNEGQGQKLDKEDVKKYIKDVVQKTIKDTIEENLGQVKPKQNSQNTTQNNEQNAQKQNVQPRQNIQRNKKDRLRKNTPTRKPRTIEPIKFEPQRYENYIDTPTQNQYYEYAPQIEPIRQQPTGQNGPKRQIREIREIPAPVPTYGRNEITKNEVIQEIFEDPKKLVLEEQASSSKSFQKKRLLLVSIFMLLALVVFGVIALQGVSHITANKNEVENTRPELFEDGYQAQADAYNNGMPMDAPPKNAIEDFMIKQPKLPEKSYTPAVSKISWEASEALVKKPEFKNFLQLIGKNIKLNLQNELLLVNDIPISKAVQLDIKIAPTGDVVGINIIKTSGSTTIDQTVLKVVKDTLKYIKPPSLGFTVKNSTVTLSVDLQ